MYAGMIRVLRRRLVRPQVGRFTGGLVCVLLLAVALFWPLPPWSAEAGIAPGVIQRGFHGAETATDGSGRDFHWTADQQATIIFEHAQRMQPAVLRMQLYGCANSVTPLTLTLNEQSRLNINLDNTWRTYQVLVPFDLPHPDYSVVVALHSLNCAVAEGRNIGVAVGHASMQQIASVPLLSPLHEPWSFLLLLIALGGLVWWRRSGLALLMLASWLFVALLYQPQFLPRDLLLALLVVGLLALWGLTVRLPVWSGAPVLLVLWLLLSPQLLGTWLLDDAYISLRYAANLAHGHGLVFNLGERVEGYTNFLWTLLLAGATYVGADALLVAAALNLGLAFALVLLTLYLARQIVPPSWAWATGLLLVLSAPFLLYTSRGSGMETALFALLVLATLASLAGQHWCVAGLLAALTLLTRPDGAIVAVAGGIYVLYVGLHMAKQPSRINIAPLLRFVVPCLAVYVPYFVWRWSYYGYLLPNTFYAKVGGTEAQVLRGAAYLSDFAQTDLLLPAAVVGLLVGLWGWRVGRGLPSDVSHPQTPSSVSFFRTTPHPRSLSQREKGPRSEVVLAHRNALRTKTLSLRDPSASTVPLIGLLVGFAGLWCAYVVLVGGDWMPGARFFVPLLPVLVLLLVWGLAGLAQRTTPTVALLALVLLVSGLLLRLPHDSRYNSESLVVREVGVVEQYRAEGRWIARHTPPDTLIVAGPAGALPFYAERPTIDALGLNDEYIAHLPSAHLGTGKAGHEKTDPNYVLGRQPDVIPWSAAAYLRGHPTLARDYRLVEQHAPDGALVRLFIRRTADVLTD